jgi:hypothetical protein
MAKRKQGVTVADLSDGYEGHVFLYCDVCGAEFSACKGDYFATSADHVFQCDHGGEGNFYGMPPVNMRLVRKVTRLVGVR